VLEVNGFMTDPSGGTRARSSGTAQINLRDIGITFNTPPEDGVVVIDDRVHIGLEIEAIREPTDLHGKD
jgi:hypothetical protein